MNILVSYNWLKEYLKTSKKAADFARQFSLMSHSVERIKEIKPTWTKVITAKILEIKPHPNANRLQLAKVTTGEQTFEVVCGAPNIKPGQVVPLALEGAVLASAENGGMTVRRVAIRGIESCGMLCSQKELGIGLDHTGIFILPPDTKLGVPLEKVFPVADQILEIEVTSNRPDCMSVIGLAREGAAVLGDPLKIPVPKPALKMADKLPLKVKITESKLCPRYEAIVMSSVKVGPSPLWLQARLLAAGLRPINNVADITNYVMLEYGQPMHVFDYHKLEGGQIIVRKAKVGEKILALDGKWYNLTPNNLVIADAQQPMAIAGVMGGEHSAAVHDTTAIVFESANFDPVSVRKTSRALNLISDSSNLFEKGLSVESPSLALLRAVELTQKIAGGKIATKIIDVGGKIVKPVKIKFDYNLVERYLGIKIPPSQIIKILKRLGFKVSGKKNLIVRVPWWRTGDVAFDHDLIEEIARVYGYHRLGVELPTGAIPQTVTDKKFWWEDQTKQWLAGLGFSEIYSYSLISAKLLQAGNIDPRSCIRLINPLSSDLEFLRPNLIPSLLQTAAANQDNFPEQKLFEISKVFIYSGHNSLPQEPVRLAGVIISLDNIFYQVKGVIEFLINKWGIGGCKARLINDAHSLMQAGQTVEILVGDVILGQFGLIDKKTQSLFSLKKSAAIFDFDFEAIVKLAQGVKSLKPLPKFPAVVRDLAIVVDPALIWKTLKEFVASSHNLIKQVEYLSTYVGAELEGKKCVAFRMTFQADDKTLESAVVDDIIKNLIKNLGNEFGARLRQ